MKKLFIVVIILFSLGICRVVIAQAIDHLTIQQIRDSIFQSPHEEVGMGTGGGLPALRDSADMKAVARSPLMYVDSLLYVNPLGSPLDYPPLVVETISRIDFLSSGKKHFSTDY